MELLNNFSKLSKRQQQQALLDFVHSGGEMEDVVRANAIPRDEVFDQPADVTVEGTAAPYGLLTHLGGKASVENLSNNTGGWGGGLMAAGGILQQMALGAARGGPNGLGSAVAEGFATGVGNMPRHFAEARAMRDAGAEQDYLRNLLEDPSLGAEERRVLEGYFTGGSDLAAIELSMQRIGAQRAAAGARGGPTNANRTKRDEILKAREFLAELDRISPDLASRVIRDQGVDSMNRVRALAGSRVPYPFGDPGFDEWSQRAPKNALFEVLGDDAAQPTADVPRGTPGQFEDMSIDDLTAGIQGDFGLALEAAATPPARTMGTPSTRAPARRDTIARENELRGTPAGFTDQGEPVYHPPIDWGGVGDSIWGAMSGIGAGRSGR